MIQIGLYKYAGVEREVGDLNSRIREYHLHQGKIDRQLSP